MISSLGFGSNSLNCIFISIYFHYAYQFNISLLRKIKSLTHYAKGTLVYTQLIIVFEISEAFHSALAVLCTISLTVLLRYQSLYII